MKQNRIVISMLAAILGNVGLSQAAVTRSKSDETPASILSVDQRPVAAGFNDEGAQDAPKADEMKKKSKPKKKKKSKAS